MNNEVPASLRTTESEKAYQYAKMEGALKPLSEEEIVKEWVTWKLIRNRFPYNSCFKQHDMLIPKRDIAFRHQLNDIEKYELEQIIQDYAEPNYDLVFENMVSRRSVMSTFHLHFASYYDSREEFSL